jgi:hypothetical protein
MEGGLMALRIRVTSPVYCGKCGRRRGPLHTCIVCRANGRTTLKAPKVMLASCPRCGKPYSNPFSHVCVSKRGDFKRRKAQAGKRAKAATPKLQRPAHDYQTCRDPDCRRYGCVAHRDGYDRGSADAAAMAEARGSR